MMVDVNISEEVLTRLRGRVAFLAQSGPSPRGSPERATGSVELSA
ncbi:hypothetical protein USDA257_p04290 (plasmid) [Sinorhizobium fredii USDA 257]|uniref:Uncharacterized protein n=1 Tax=Sinorhizobium fredii (strain USDA 257) TaxID=1185652 RepID=I3XGY8_SINF2|nr:hypothetical protein USDA257_p04290 [Sinorhizobium fredii USDA 257]